MENRKIYYLAEVSDPAEVIPKEWGTTFTLKSVSIPKGGNDFLAGVGKSLLFYFIPKYKIVNQRRDTYISRTHQKCDRKQDTT